MYKRIIKKTIYIELSSGDTFNGPLYAKHFGESEEAIERLEIEK